MNKTSKYSLLVLVVISSLCALFYFIYMYILIQAHLEIGGKIFGSEHVGRLNNNMPNFGYNPCSGIKKTKNNTWLLTTQNEVDYSNLPFLNKGNNIKLEEILYGSKFIEPKGSSELYFSMFTDRSKVSILSKLDSNGVFQPVTSVQENACLYINSDGSEMYLITDLELPKTNNNINQKAIFFSNDQAKKWSWLKDGIVPESGNLNSNDMHNNLSLYGVSEKWVIERNNGKVYYTNNKIPESKQVINIDDLQVNSEYVYNFLSRDQHKDEYEQLRTELSPHVIQLDDTNAVVFLSQYHHFKYNNDIKNIIITTQKSIKKHNGSWVYTGNTTYYNNMAIVGIQSAGNSIFAIIIENDITKIAHFDIESGNMVIMSNIPDAFFPLSAHSFLNKMSVSEKLIAVNVLNSYEVPSFISHKRKASISAHAVFASKNNGKTWEKISIPGSSGLITVIGDTIYYWTYPFSWDVSIYKMN
ncbi:hypothetical protein [Rahnella victoriana]|uniref:Exo-alpha-sialidase n=1 Tax=Rahnella victoriana TaxID=1510570 RepID=A0ABS0DWB8_9GAMM|nr:hypothetical protein [Rahnella victoriana]MBF7958157.1 hypothetical protein [Rahnella victoriana]